jgi:hypothetical protein
MEGTAEERQVSAYKHARLTFINRGRILLRLGVSSSMAPASVREGTNAMDSMKRPGSGEAKLPTRKFMPESISLTRKKPRGRPPTGAESIHLRLLPYQLAALDQWIAHQSDMPSRPEAVRRLLVLGLTVTSKKR